LLRGIIQNLALVGIPAARLGPDRMLVESNDCLKTMLGLVTGEGVGEDIGAVLAAKATDHVPISLSSVFRFSREPGASWFRLDLKSFDKAFVGILTDVGQTYEPREEARQYNETRDELLRDAKIGIWRYDPDAELYYFSSELSLGHQGVGAGVPVALLKLLQHPDDQAKDDEIRARITREGGSATAEIRYMEASGAWTHLAVDYRAGRRLASGRYEMFGLSQNITAVANARDEASRLSERLTLALRNADYANRTKTEFLANMSHELRTPLNGILGFSEMIEQQIAGPINAKYVGYAHDIHHSGEHLLALVNDVLDLAKLEAGKLELHETEVAVPGLIDDCLTLVRGKADAGKIRVSRNIMPNVPKIRGDLRAIKQILLNFLSNAVKFTPEGGTVTVLTSLDKSGHFCLAVRDSGIGMTKAEAEIALSPFGQIDSKLARKHEGTGLGLPICKSLLELHDAEIIIDSEPGAGTTLTARFPSCRVLIGQAA
jgi:signal transduction histidine kinase